mgnify:FL=1
MHFQAWKPWPPTPPKVPLEAPSIISPPGSCTYQVRGLSGLLPSWSKDRGSIYWLPVRDSIYGLFLLRRGTSVLCVGYQDISRPHALVAERDFLLISLCGGYPCSHSSMGWGGGTPVNRRTTPAHFPIVHSHLALSLVFTPALASGQEGTLAKILAGGPRSNNFASFPNVPPLRNPDFPVFPCPWTMPENWFSIISPKSYILVVNHVSSNLPNFFRGELPHFQPYLSSGHKHLRTFFGASTFFGIWQTSNFSFWSRFKLKISNSTEIWHMHPNKIKALFSSPWVAKICFFRECLSFSCRCYTPNTHTELAFENWNAIGHVLPKQIPNLESVPGYLSFSINNHLVTKTIFTILNAQGLVRPMHLRN